MRYCDHCERPLSSAWVIEVDDRSYHSAREHRGADRRRCRDVALKLRQADTALEEVASDAALFAG